MGRIKVNQANRDHASGNTRMRIEQWTRNPTCAANTISAVRNVRMSAVARAEDIPVTFGQSPFAIARGIQFEKGLFSNGASMLIAELIRNGVLPDGSSGFEDLRLVLNSGSRVASIDEAIDQTRVLLEQAAGSRSTRNGPAIAAGAALRIPRGILLAEAILILDALVIRRQARGTDRHSCVLFDGTSPTGRPRSASIHRSDGKDSSARS